MAMRGSPRRRRATTPARRSAALAAPAAFVRLGLERCGLGADALEQFRLRRRTYRDDLRATLGLADIAMAHAAVQINAVAHAQALRRVKLAVHLDLTLDDVNPFFAAVTDEWPEFLQ